MIHELGNLLHVSNLRLDVNFFDSQMISVNFFLLPIRSAVPHVSVSNIVTVMQVKVLFLILMDLCRRTSGLAHPLPVSQVGSSNIQVRLHYIDGNYTVLPEVVEASLGPHMQVF